MGAPSWRRAEPTLAISERASAAVALVGPDGAIERATALFLDCCGDADAFLLEHAIEIDTVVGGEAFHATAKLAWATAEITAVTDANGQRCALLTITRPASDGADGGLDPLLDAAIEASPAIVWLKDLEGRYLRVNRQYLEQLRTSVDRVRGKTDGELESGESIERLRLQGAAKPANEPLELEYMVGAAGGLPAFAVLRFALRDADGEPSAVCGVAAALGRPEVARSECKRFMRLATWRRGDESAIRAGLIAEWGLTPLTPSHGAGLEQPHPQQEPIETDGDQFAALAAELDAALETSARLDQELAEERRQVMVLREASVLSARRAQELLRSVTAERARSAELEESLSRVEGRAVELERERDSERSRADRAEGVSVDALAHEREIAETLRAELTASREELQRVQTAAREAPTPGQLEAERAETHKAKLAAEQAQAEVATMSAALAREQRTVETLRDELRAAEEEIGHVRRAASEAAAQAPTQDELEQERRRADRANAALTSLRARAEMSEAEAKSILAQARSELRRSNEEAAATSRALAAEKEQVAALRGELTELRDELEATRRELSERPTAGHADGLTPAASAELAQAQMRADRAEAALHDQSVIAEQAAASAEAERIKAAAAVAAADAERETAESLRAELSAAQAELERAQSESSATKTGTSHRDPEAPPVQPSAPRSPVWQPASQRALCAALTAVDDWRTALKETVKIVGEAGGWDAVVAWCPDRGRKLMQCVAMWSAEATISSTFETRIWQHRPKLPDERGSAWRPPAPATSSVDLETAEDALLRAAADEGIGSAVLVPIHDGTQLIGTLQLMSRHPAPPPVELMLSLEGVALQLATISRLLEASSTPQWRARAV